MDHKFGLCIYLLMDIGLFPSFRFVNNAAMIMSLQVFVCTYIFIYFIYWVYNFRAIW